jgi:hypothetical protein
MPEMYGFEAARIINEIIRACKEEKKVRINSVTSHCYEKRQVKKSEFRK